MRVIAPTFQLPQPLWPAWHTRHERLVRCSESLRLLPGDPPEQPADAWPSFLFLFRAVHGDLRISEVRSVSEMLGYAGGRIAPTGHGVAPEQLPIVESIGGDTGPSIFQYVSFPDEAAAAAVARRCVMVRGVYEVWADFECDEADSGDQSWQRLASMLAEAPEAQKARMLAPLGSDSWRVDVRSFGRRKPYSLAQKRRLMDHLAELLWRIPGDVDLADSSERVTLLEDYRRGKADGPGDGGPCRLLLGRRVCAGAGRLLYTYGLPRRHHLSRTALPPDLSFLMANQVRVRVRVRVRVKVWVWVGFGLGFGLGVRLGFGFGFGLACLPASPSSWPTRREPEPLTTLAPGHPDPQPRPRTQPEPQPQP